MVSRWELLQQRQLFHLVYHLLRRKLELRHVDLAPTNDRNLQEQSHLVFRLEGLVDAQWNAADFRPTGDRMLRQLGELGSASRVASFPEVVAIGVFNSFVDPVDGRNWAQILQLLGVAGEFLVAQMVDGRPWGNRNRLITVAGMVTKLLADRRILTWVDFQGGWTRVGQPERSDSRWQRAKFRAVRIRRRLDDVYTTWLLRLLTVIVTCWYWPRPYVTDYFDCCEDDFEALMRNHRVPFLFHLFYYFRWQLFVDFRNDPVEVIRLSIDNILTWLNYVTLMLITWIIIALRGQTVRHDPRRPRWPGRRGGHPQQRRYARLFGFLDGLVEKLHSLQADTFEPL